MPGVVVALEDKLNGPLVRLLRRTVSYFKHEFNHVMVVFDSVRGQGGFEKFVKASLPLAASKGWVAANRIVLSNVSAAVCVLDADKAHKLLGCQSCPPGDTTGWLRDTEQEFGTWLQRRWAGSAQVTIKPVLLRWNLESTLLATFESWTTDDVLNLLAPLTATGSMGEAGDLFLSSKCLISGHAADPRSLLTEDFTTRLRRPLQCTDDYLSALGIGGVFKGDPKWDEVMSHVTKQAPVIQRVSSRVPDVARIAQAIIELAYGR